MKIDYSGQLDGLVITCLLEDSILHLFYYTTTTNNITYYYYHYYCYYY